MDVLITGIGDAFTRRSFGSSALVRADDGYVQIDCPDPYHHVLADATATAGWDVDALGIHDIILTHLHGDHSNGLETFGFSRRIAALHGDTSPRPRLHCTQSVADRLWEKLGPAMYAPIGTDAPSTLEDFFDVRIISPDEPTTIAGLIVHCRPTGHPIPTVGLQLGDHLGTLGWSGDTPFEQAHVDWLNAADVIVHESSPGPVHTAIEKLNALPDDVRRKIRLIHLPDDFNISLTDMVPLAQGEVLHPRRGAHRP
jgi:ribonuclease BN (tRNA processing enzyme)